MRTLYIASFAAALGVAALPATAQPYQSYESPRWSHADEHRAHEAAHEAERQAEHARRDAEAGDYHGAFHARQRAHEAYDESVRHGGYQQQEYGRHGYEHGPSVGHAHEDDE